MDCLIRLQLLNENQAKIDSLTDFYSNNFKRIFPFEWLHKLHVPEIAEPAKKTNFTIDYILGKNESKTDIQQYDWLHCTRYRPPKLQRIRKKECIQRRRLGRNPRIPFSSEQVTILESKFRMSPYLSNNDVTELAKCLQLSEARIKIWFQNRRARERRDGNDFSEKGLNVIKSFLVKTRNSDAEVAEDLSMSAFKPCQTFHCEQKIN